MDGLEALAAEMREDEVSGAGYYVQWSSIDEVAQMLENAARRMAALVAEVARLRGWQERVVPVLTEAIRTDVFGCDLHCQCWKHDGHRLLNEAGAPIIRSA